MRRWSFDGYICIGMLGALVLVALLMGIAQWQQARQWPAEGPIVTLRVEAPRQGVFTTSPETYIVIVDDAQHGRVTCRAAREIYRELAIGDWVQCTDRYVEVLR